jgi:ABC-type Fe3+/spermidine/putrescine transport system ATPase subunit
MMTKPTAVELHNVSLAYGNFVAVKDVNLTIHKGDFVTLLGPSGCGKTTILRSIAGLVQPTSGKIIVAGQRIDNVPIHKRNIGLVFQNYALFPHKSVHDNIAFGLKYRGMEKSAIARKVKHALETVRLPGVERKLPSELSGGQQQRIALARAIVIEPDVLLLDEPLSALDANLREEMRTELKTIQREIGITSIFVTHDQEEALAMSDLIVVMNKGVVEQQGTPLEVYRRPDTRFVASFLGQSNLIAGKIAAIAEGRLSMRLDNGVELSAFAPASARPGQAVTAVVRAQRLALTTPGSAPGELRATVASASYLGGTAAYIIDLSGLRLQANATIEDRVWHDGETVALAIAPQDILLLDEHGRRLA